MGFAPQWDRYFGPWGLPALKRRRRLSDELCHAVTRETCKTKCFTLKNEMSARNVLAHLRLTRIAYSEDDDAIVILMWKAIMLNEAIS